MEFLGDCENSSSSLSSKVMVLMENKYGSTKKNDIFLFICDTFHEFIAHENL